MFTVYCLRNLNRYTIAHEELEIAGREKQFLSQNRIRKKAIVAPLIRL